jgi:hypothetical protein
VTKSDPTDHALAAIANILDHPETPRETDKPAGEPKLVSEPKPLAPVIPSPAITDGDDYSKVGPGPIAAIRFKWTARKDSSGDYFVDETIGEHSAPMVTGPMTRDEAIQLVDQRESEARHRFEQLRHEMTGRAAAAADLVHTGEA